MNEKKKTRRSHITQAKSYKVELTTRKKIQQQKEPKRYIRQDSNERERSKHTEERIIERNLYAFAASI